MGPVRLRVRIGPLHLLACRNRRLNGAVLQMRPINRDPARVTAAVTRLRSLPAKRGI
jgi:hypothetical protein